jgi:hypothetical protein
MISRRSKYAVPNAETRHGSIGGNCQALPEECSEAENRKLLAQTIEEYEHNVSSEKNVRAPTGKATERATQQWTTAALIVGPLGVYNSEARYTT